MTVLNKINNKLWKYKLARCRSEFIFMDTSSIIDLPIQLDCSICSIAKNTHIHTSSRIVDCSGGGHFIVKENCGIGYNFTALVGADIVIGNDVAIASNVFIASGSHGINPEIEIPYGEQKYVCQTVEIKNGAWIGENCNILPGVVIGEKAVIGAGSCVTKIIPDYSIAVGNPAKVIKKYNFETHRWERCYEE